jgi:hypothetical protein
MANLDYKFFIQLFKEISKLKEDRGYIYYKELSELRL